MEKTEEGAVESGSLQEFRSKYTRFEFHMEFLIRDVKWKVERERKVGNKNIGVVSK